MASAGSISPNIVTPGLSGAPQTQRGAPSDSASSCSTRCPRRDAAALQADGLLEAAVHLDHVAGSRPAGAGRPRSASPAHAGARRARAPRARREPGSAAPARAARCARGRRSRRRPDRPRKASIVATRAGSKSFQTPLDERKSGMPEAVETPAPVSATAQRAPRSMAASSCTWPSTGRSYASTVGIDIDWQPDLTAWCAAYNDGGRLLPLAPADCAFDDDDLEHVRRYVARDRGDVVACGALRTTTSSHSPGVWCSTCACGRRRGGTARAAPWRACCRTRGRPAPASCGRMPGKTTWPGTGSPRGTASPRSSATASSCASCRLTARSRRCR